MASIPYNRILVGIDGSKQAKRAVLKAIASTKRNDAELIIATVMRQSATKASFGYIDQEMLDEVKTEFEELVAKYKQAALDEGLKNVETIVKYGNPKTELANTLPLEKGVDLIILGATGANVVERMMMGSTASYVVANAASDVLIIRTNQANEPLKR